MRRDSEGERETEAGVWAGDDEDDLEGMEIEFRRRPRSISILEREREIKKI